MTVPILLNNAENSKPIWLATPDLKYPNGLNARDINWGEANAFDGKPGSFLIIPNEDGQISGALFGTGGNTPDELLGFGKLAHVLPAGVWHFANQPQQPDLAVLGFMLGSYRFEKYKANTKPVPQLVCPTSVDFDHITTIAQGIFLARDLINTPANDMDSQGIEDAACMLARRFNADISIIKGEALEQGFPMIHAVGRAASQEPRLIDFTYGDTAHPRITLVGKGVAFDTGGLDIKPSSSMLLMKKDMGGAANVLALAHMIMTAQLPVRLRVLIPAVENVISSNAFRPSDVLRSRSGLSVEIGNTDAEGRLILADALHYASQENPDLLIDMATLTGAARVALGPDLPPFFTNDDDFAHEMIKACNHVADPVWRLPLWQPYDSKLASKIADVNNVTSDGFAGSITAALFLQRFVINVKSWVHFDIYAWSPSDKFHAPMGGEAQAIRGLFELLQRRYLQPSHS
jgi:leucyl aminopeptidase